MVLSEEAESASYYVPDSKNLHLGDEVFCNYLNHFSFPQITIVEALGIFLKDILLVISVTTITESD